MSVARHVSWEHGGKGPGIRERLTNGLAEAVGFGIFATVLPGTLLGLEAGPALALGAVGFVGGLIFGVTRSQG